VLLILLGTIVLVLLVILLVFVLGDGSGEPGTTTTGAPPSSR
jgi:hypothetical protein